MENDQRGFTSLMQLAQGYIISGSLYALAKKGVTKALAEGGKTSQQLSKEIGADFETLERFMTTMTECGIFSKKDNLYELNEISRFLPVLLDFFISGDDMLAWTKADETITSGTPGWNLSHNNLNIYEFLSKNSGYAEKFFTWLDESTNRWILPLISLYDFTGVKSVIDLGGGSGAIAGFLSKIYPNMNCSVLDLLSNNLFNEKLTGKVNFIQGDILKFIPAGYDLYILSRVLLNYPNDLVEKILLNCCNAMSTNARLLIIDFLTPEKDNPFYRQALLQDLHLKVIYGGKNRTLDELSLLLKHAGLSIIKPVTDKNTPLLYGLEAHKH